MRNVLVFLALVSGLAHAYNYTEIDSSKGALVGAINGALGSDMPLDNSHYLPGYGLSFYIDDSLTFTLDPLGSREIIDRLSETLLALNGTVRGLDEADWISITYATGTIMGMGDMLSGYEVLVRIKPSDVNSLEVYVDGVKR